MEKIEVDISSLANAPNSQGAFALILKEIDGNRQLPIIIGAFEAQAIAMRLENITPPRPMTHDLFVNFVNDAGLIIKEIFINELKEGAFYSQIICETEDGDLEIDSRPSDAIAIALRVDAPIFVAETVLEEAGITLPDEEVKKEIKKMKDLITFEKVAPTTSIEKLNEQLSKAIKDEDYEKAAKLRDDIKKITHSS